MEHLKLCRFWYFNQFEPATNGTDGLKTTHLMLTKGFCTSRTRGTLSDIVDLTDFKENRIYLQNEVLQLSAESPCVRLCPVQGNPFPHRSR